MSNVVNIKPTSLTFPLTFPDDKFSRSTKETRSIFFFSKFVSTQNQTHDQFNHMIHPPTPTHPSRPADELATTSPHTPTLPSRARKQQIQNTGE